MKLNPIFKLDGYKTGHGPQYPNWTEYVYTNLTPRNGRDPEDKGVLWWSLQRFWMDLVADFNENFFGGDRDAILAEYQEFLDSYLGPNNIGTDHIAALWDLGYLPLELRALPEGTFVPYGIPVLTIENTLPEFFWLTNYFETLISAELWLPITSATTARTYRQILDEWAEKTSDTPEFVDWQGHDFSFRGMENADAAAVSGAGHLLFFTGTDTIPAIFLLKEYYDGQGLIGGSVAATEHSVMCAGGKDDELETFRRLMEDVHPAGILSIVSDTWDLKKVITEIAVTLKNKIMSRDGKVVFRPDSGDPVKIICGDPDSTDEFYRKGVVESLWDIFGGTLNSKGFKVLDSHVGVIYGDSITKDRAKEICRQLAAKGFASTNIVFGIGSFTYQYVTRDSHGMAMKATWVCIDGEESGIWKKPATDNGNKTSARGRLAVQRNEAGELVLIQDLTFDEWAVTPSLLEKVWEDGQWFRLQTLSEVRELARA